MPKPPTVTVRVELTGRRNRECLVFLDPKTGQPLLKFWPHARRFLDPVTGETGRCDSREQAVGAAQARFVYLAQSEESVRADASPAYMPWYSDRRLNWQR